MLARLLSLAVLLLGVPAGATQLTDFHPGEVWLDTNGTPINAHGGGILYQDGTYYWFGEHKTAGPGGNVAHVGVHCYSSTDLYNWKDEGVALAVTKEPGSEIEDGCIIERPKVLYNAKTKQYVMWFHLELKGHGYSTARCGIATSDKVTGPYTYVKSLRPDASAWPLNVMENEKKGALARDFAGGQMARDMTLFQDDDGTAYLVASSEDNRNLHVSELTDDYLGTTGKYVRTLSWSEAPAVFKHQGKYYLIVSGCSGWKPNAATVAVADSMLGPWKSLGNPCQGTLEQNKTTFASQSTAVIPIMGGPEAFIFMGDRWRPNNAIDGRYVWLPIQFEDGKPILKWTSSWNLHAFDTPSPAR